MKQAQTSASQVTNPININTNFSLKGNPKPDAMDHENKLPAIVGEIALKKNEMNGCLSISSSLYCNVCGTMVSISEIYVRSMLPEHLTLVFTAWAILLSDGPYWPLERTATIQYK